MTAAERRLAEARAKKEQEEDMRLLKLNVQLEKEAAERSKQERQMLLSLHQSRADKIAMLATVDKARQTLYSRAFHVNERHAVVVVTLGCLAISYNTACALKNTCGDKNIRALLL